MLTASSESEEPNRHHAVYKDEVINRWGEDAWAKADRWWRRLTPAEKKEFQDEHKGIIEEYATAREAGEDPNSAHVQKIAMRHYNWIAKGWSADRKPNGEQFSHIADLYAQDPRFAVNYEKTPGDGGAEFVSAAMKAFAVNILGVD